MISMTVIYFSYLVCRINLYRMRRRLKQYEAEALGIKWKGLDSSGRSPRYYLTEQQEKDLQVLRESDKTPDRVWGLDEQGKLLPIEEYCEVYGLPLDEVVRYKVVTHTGTPFYNIEFKPHTLIEDPLDISATFEKFTFKRKKNKVEPRESGGFDRLVLTDIHIGMNPDAEGVSMYGNTWSLEDIEATRERIVQEVAARKWSDVLVIEQLGDLLDGFDKKTTRGGHELPQNMSNQEQFDNAIGFMVDLVDDLYSHFSLIRLENVCNDNHAGDFGYMACQAVKLILEAKYENVKVTNHTQFISHYVVGQSLSVISHGKDKIHNKFGFKPILDTKQIEKIDQYIKFHGLYKYRNIRFAKGDSHQAIFDDTTSNDFTYNSYPALSPASEWVQSNFKNSKRGFAYESEESETGIVTRSMIYL
jgi:hypothetical protein